MTEKVDGRKARSERTRERVIESMLALIREGDLRPTAERIAQRAGVSERSVFQHFNDREALFEAVSRRQAEAIVEMWQPVPREGPFAERLDVFVDRRATLLEYISPTRRAALLVEPDSKVFQDGLTLFRTALRSEVQQVFASELELSGVSPEAVAATASWSYWNNLRQHQELSEGRAREVLHDALRALLT